MAAEDRFAELLSHVAREVTIRQASDVCCGDLTLEQFQTLRVLDVSGPSSIGSLSTQLRVDVSTMSRNLSVLERNGYLSRARGAADARVVQVKLTAKGTRALHTLRCGERDVLSDVYDRLAPAKRPRIMKALESLSACLVRAQDGQACCPPATNRKPAS